MTLTFISSQCRSSVSVLVVVFCFAVAGDLLRSSCSFGPPLSQFVGAHGWCANHPLGFETSLSRSQPSPSTSSFQTDLSQRTTLAIQVPASKCTTQSCSIMVGDDMILYILGSTLVKASGRS